MKLKDIAAVSGKSGLYRVLSAGKGGMVLEALENKARMVVPVSQKISLFSIYTSTREGTVSLESVLKKIRAEYGNDTGLDGNAGPDELHAFFKSVLPEYDVNRVYTSDIRKLIRWYSLLAANAPEVLSNDQ